MKMYSTCCSKQPAQTSQMYVGAKSETAFSLTDNSFPSFIVLIVRNRSPSSEIAPFSQLQHICCKFNSCSDPRLPAVQHSVTQRSHSKQTDGHYIQCFSKKVCNHFHEAQGCCSSVGTDEMYKKPQIWTSTWLPMVSFAMCLFHKPTYTHSAPNHRPPVLLWYSCDHTRMKAIV